MAKTRASVRFFRDTALGATCLFAACSSGSGAPAGGGNSTGGTPPPPTGFALFTSNRTLAGVFEPWIASYDGTDLRPLGALLPDGGAILEWGARMSSDGRYLASVTAGLTDTHYSVLDVEAGTALTLPFSGSAASAPARTSFAFSPDSRRLLLTRDDGLGRRTAHVMNADGTNVLELAFGGDEHGASLWSPNSQHFLCWVERQDPFEDSLFLVRHDGTTALDLIPPIGESRGTLEQSWSADGSKLAFEFHAEPTGGGQDFSQIWVYDTASSSLVAITPQYDFVRNLGLSADGATLAYWLNNGPGNRAELYVMSTLGGGGTFVAFDATYDLEWAPAGDHFSYVTLDGTATRALHVADSSGATRRLDMQTTSSQRVAEWSWSPDGRWLAFVVEHPTPQREVWVADVTTSDPAVLVTEVSVHSDGRLPRWSPDSRWLYAIERERTSQADVLNAWPTGDWSARRSLGKSSGAAGPLISGFGDMPFVPTPDSTAVIWRRRGDGGTQTEVVWARPGDPGSLRVLSSPPAPGAVGGVWQMFAR